MKEYEYLKRLGKCISNGSVRGEILDEYKAHLEDCREALMKNGMSKAEAEEEAVRQMGNPEEAGNELNQIHARVLDFSMFWWMMFFAFLVPVFEVISRLVTAGKYGIVGFMNEYQGMNQIPLQVHLVVGTAILCYGIILSIWEKYSGKELFYAYGRNWKGSYLTNSGTVMALAGLICSAAIPVRGFVKGMIGVFAATVLNIIIRTVMNLIRNRREQKYLWEIGLADTEITWNGKGTICGVNMKVRARASEEGAVIPSGAPIMVVSMEGFKPVVIAI